VHIAEDPLDPFGGQIREGAAEVEMKRAADRSNGARTDCAALGEDDQITHQELETMAADETGANRHELDKNGGEDR
jgi:hypothetical protein